MAALANMLVLLDFSSRSEAALRYAAELARRNGATLMLLSVVAPDPSAAARSGPASASQRDAQRLADTERRLGEAKRYALAVGAPVVHTSLLYGTARDEILRAALRDRSNLIVMGTRNRRGRGDGPKGSLAEHLMRHAPCPVFTVDDTSQALTDVTSRAGTARKLP